ncbi:polysaccharide deacetylase family protein [Spirochaetia bacterium 38H-sp]|uniref:Polysaccharide deacetylase family protein n=1 Tax=Rarispira pelagica TaxID=3141764 RepID=A0ABU9U9R8_9SPIR
MRKLLSFFVLFGLTFFVFAGEVEFSELLLSPVNTVLFTAILDVPSYGTYRTAFYAELDSKKLTQLTFFPESLLYLKEAGMLQVYNRFGMFRTRLDSPDMQPVPGFDSFVSGADIYTTAVLPVSVSPDGKFLVRFRPISPAFANLVLLDVSSGSELVVAEKVELSYKEIPVVWSPDSSMFIYHADNNLYYFPISQWKDGRLLDTARRRIGKGTIRNIFWGSNGLLYYVEGTVVTSFLPEELYTHAFYYGVVKVGRIAGKIPFHFDGNFDRFWIGPEQKYILISRSGRNIFMYPLSDEDFSSSELQQPYLLLPRSEYLADIIWGDDGKLSIFIRGISDGKINTRIMWMLAGTDSAFKSREEQPDVWAVSSDDKYLAYSTGSIVHILSYDEWRELASFEHDSPVSMVWAGDELVVGGAYTTVLYDRKGNLKQVLCFSQPEKMGFYISDYRPLLSSSDYVWGWDKATSTWRSFSAFDTALPVKSTDAYRVYLEDLPAGPYKNIIKMRNMRGVGTELLFSGPSGEYEDFPSQDEPIDFSHFTHGSRLRGGREVALVFNAVSSAEGLTEILEVLKKYNITATFFVNGDFIRENPGACREIAAASVEVGSLFYTNFDMSDTRFSVSEGFIQQGLARNEDEYFSVTGKELALLWHAPYYFVREDILSAASEMNYTYVGADVDSLDWVPRFSSDGISRLYAPAANLVERIIRIKRPGSIIAMTVGRPDEKDIMRRREDFLFTRLEVLINALIERGYRFATVSELLEHAR